MKALATWLLMGICGVCLFSETAWAHRVRIYAWTEGQEIVAEAGFGKNRPAKHCPVYLQDAASGAGLAETETDGDGIARFAIPSKAAEEKMNLRLVVNAGEGHRGEWILEAADYLNGAMEKADASQADKPTVVSPLPYAMVSSAGGTTKPEVKLAVAGISQAELEQAVEKAVNKAMESRLGPLRRMLTEALDPTPGIPEIIGGLGWLVGLAGIAMYFRGRSRR
ncbi:MAG: hypothetical protein ACNI3A_12030 [Desulfovibrio sp.]|uniref:hypothetical protein n=1 Tax=Desulfovibrio sp. 7SRBS1 TaxID=3378064 RepID=UPI003B4104E9